MRAELASRLIAYIRHVVGHADQLIARGVRATAHGVPTFLPSDPSRTGYYSQRPGSNALPGSLSSLLPARDFFSGKRVMPIRLFQNRL